MCHIEALYAGHIAALAKGFIVVHGELTLGLVLRSTWHRTPEIDVYLVPPLHLYSRPDSV